MNMTGTNMGTGCMEGRTPLTRDMKVTLLQVLKNGYVTQEDIACLQPSIAKPEDMTDKELQQQLDHLQKINLGLTDDEWADYMHMQNEWLKGCRKKH